MNGGRNGYGTYEIPKENNLKSYYIKNDNYTDDSFKKSGKVIAPMEGTSGNERFYVMALEDINPGTRYCWYDAASGSLEGPFIGTSENDFATAGAEKPTGRTNTERMIRIWKAEDWGVQDDNDTYDDMWGGIQEEVANGWFAPSKSEWAAFGAAFNITSSTYQNFGLSPCYWSSSQYNTYAAYYAEFYDGNVSAETTNFYYWVRLATTL